MRGGVVTLNLLLDHGGAVLLRVVSDVTTSEARRDEGLPTNPVDQ